MDLSEALLIEKYDYVMAPLTHDIYARGRVLDLKKINGIDYAFILFIDDAYGHWMSVDCLAKMECILHTHPWQAIPISLFKLIPGMELNDLKELKDWPESITNILEKILLDYKLFRVSPIPNSKRPNDYYEYVRVSFFV